jgi:NRPS condensation-like uncharacterized protein
MKIDRNFNWFRLDNAAKIYPASHNRYWSNLFRLSATLYEEVDLRILEEAIKNTIPRFPSMAARLSEGVFWYYLRPVSEPPAIMAEYSYPLAYMTKKEMKTCAFRVIVYRNRIALELFHSLTDGTGGLIFLKSLVAEYLELKHKIEIPCTHGILSRKEQPRHYETEDSFLKNSAPIKETRKDTDAWKIDGTPEEDGFLNITNFQMSSDLIRDMAREKKVSVNTFLTAVLMKAILNLQFDLIQNPKKYKPVKVLIPINLRPIFSSRTLRNFALYTIPEIDPRLGDYSLDEIINIVHHKVGTYATKKNMSKMIETNVADERTWALRIIPLFIKNFVMKMVFNSVGEKKSCLSFSNLGEIRVPDEMKQYIDRIDFILGPQAQAPYNCSAYSYRGILNITFSRDIKEAMLENYFFRELQRLGVEVTVQSNQRQEVEIDVLR